MGRDRGEPPAGWRTDLLLTRKGLFGDNWGEKSRDALARPACWAFSDDACDGIVKPSQPRERFFPAAVQGHGVTLWNYSADEA